MKKSNCAKSLCTSHLVSLATIGRCGHKRHASRFCFAPDLRYDLFMLNSFTKILRSFAPRLLSKSSLSPPISTGSTYHTYRRRREPSPPELDNPDLWISLNHVHHFRRRAI